MCAMTDRTIDLTSTPFWVDDPHPTLRWLRQNAPVYRHEVDSSPPFWAILRHDDVSTVSKAPEAFSSAQGVTLTPLNDGVHIENMVMMDDPRHRWMRALVNRGFTPGRIRTFEPHVRAIVTEILDGVSGTGTIDFVDRVAAELPVRMIGEMLGVPHEDHHLIKDWTDVLTENAGDRDTGMADRGAAQRHMIEYFAGMQRIRSEAPRDDLVSVLMDAEVDGQALTFSEQQNFFLLLEFAGNETTRNTIAGGLHALHTFPDQRERLLAQPELIGPAVEEMLRYTSPVLYFRRTATQDTEIRGQQVAAGDWVALFYVSANRDEEVFVDPDRFDVGRDPNPHIAFGGGGAHFCLGAALARLELRILFEELLRRFPDVDVVGPAERTRFLSMGGIRRLPVRLGADRA